MPVRHFDEIGKLYSDNVTPVTKQQLLSEETVGTLPQDGFPHANKEGAPGKAFDEAGPQAAENFEVTPNDPNKKKSKKSAYNEKKLSNPVVHEKQHTKKEVTAGRKKKKDEKLLKGSNDPKMQEEAWGADTARGTWRGTKHGAEFGAKVGTGLGVLAAPFTAGLSIPVGAVAGTIAGAGTGAVTGGTAGLAGVGGYGDSAAEQKAAAAKKYNLKASAKPKGLRRKKVKLSRKIESSQINNSTMSENTNKSTFDRLFEDVMGEDFEEFGDDAGDIEIGGVEGEEGTEEFSDTVTLELPRDLAEGLHEALMDQLGGGEDVEDDFEDLGDAEELEDESYRESHVDLQAVPDTVSKLATQNGGNNKVEGSGHQPAGGSADASASGQGGDGSPQKAPEGFSYAKTKNNKVGGKVKGGNQDMFKA